MSGKMHKITPFLWFDNQAEEISLTGDRGLPDSLVALGENYDARRGAWSRL